MISAPIPPPSPPVASGFFCDERPRVQIGARTGIPGKGLISCAPEKLPFGYAHDRALSGEDHSRQLSEARGSSFSSALASRQPG
jgi:hypothetical protein